MKTVLIRALLIPLVLLHTILADAHILEGTRSKIILRDGQVEIHIDTDIAQWQQQLRSPHAWLTQEIDHRLPAALNEGQSIAFLKKLITTGLSIQVNKKPMPLTLAKFPATLQPDSEAHDGPAIVLYARHAISRVEQISVTYPKSLGSVHSSFIKPKYRTIPAGGTATVQFEF